MTNKCPHCKEILIVPMWKFCDNKWCRLERDRIKHREKNKKLTHKVG